MRTCYVSIMTTCYVSIMTTSYVRIMRTSYVSIITTCCISITSPLGSIEQLVSLCYQVIIPMMPCSPPAPYITHNKPSKLR